MKTKIKLLATLIIFASLLLPEGKISAQTSIWPAFGAPARDEIWSGQNIEQIVGGTSTETYLKGFGLNNYFTAAKVPGYMLDILCDPTASPATNKDINVQCSNCTPAYAVGYRIGGNYVLFHNGITSCIYVGVGAGNANTVTNCSFVGNNAGNSNATNDNTAIGYEALFTNAGGAGNVAIGYKAGKKNISGANNTYVGANADANKNDYSNSTALGNGTIITASNQMNISGDGNISSFVIPNTTNEKPVNASMPIGWEKVQINGSDYFIPLYQ